MKILSHENASVAKNVSAALPTKVAMHVIGMGRIDGRVMRAATALVEAGFIVSIVDVECERTCPVVEDIRGVHMKHVIIPSWFTSRRFEPWFFVKALQMLFFSILRLMQTRADIYHAHDSNALPACYIAARLRRKPLIFDAHELPPAETRITFWRRLHGLATHLLARILPKCAGVITVSQPIAQIMRERFHIPKVTLIRNVPEYQAVSKSDRLRQHLGLSANVRIALYQGNLQADRALDRLVRAATFLERDIVIVLMGKGVGATQAQLESLIADERVGDRVKILPPVPYTELLDWTASADMGLNILPPDYSQSIRFCLPNKMFEYLMAGLPVLTSELEAVVDVITAYDAGRVASSLDPAAVGAAITEMITDSDALTRMRQNALNAARHVLCWEKERNHLIRLYQEVAAATRELEVLA